MMERGALAASLANRELASPEDPGCEALAAAIALSLRAGGEVMQVYESASIEVRTKSDESPVTLADARSERAIFSDLRRVLVDTPVVCEEDVERNGAPDVDGRFWLVDPLDGTKEFISRNGEFTVNIALIVDGVPRLGVVLAPALGDLFFGVSERSAYHAQISDTADPERLVVSAERIRCRTPDLAGLTAVGSRSHRSPETDEFLSRLKVSELRPAGSSLKFCMVARGHADIYPRLGRTMEWDIAAGDAVLRAAGGQVTCLKGRVMTYGKPGFENPAFVARGAAALV